MFHCQLIFPLYASCCLVLALLSYMYKLVVDLILVVGAKVVVAEFGDSV